MKKLIQRLFGKKESMTVDGYLKQCDKVCGEFDRFNAKYGL